MAATICFVYCYVVVIIISVWMVKRKMQILFHGRITRAIINTIIDSVRSIITIDKSSGVWWVYIIIIPTLARGPSTFSAPLLVAVGGVSPLLPAGLLLSLGFPGAASPIWRRRPDNRYPSGSRHIFYNEIPR